MDSCVDGRGSAYAKSSAIGGVRTAVKHTKFEQGVEVEVSTPMIALYNADGQLIGVNLASPGAQNLPPWEHVDAGSLVGWPGREVEHWGISLYLSDPVGSCVKSG